VALADRARTVEGVLDQLAAGGVPRATLSAVGHRVVHGGSRFRAPVVLDAGVLAELDELTELAPLHNLVAVDTARAAAELLPDLAHVAVFDTAFHATLDEEAFVYPLPWRWYAEWGIRRYGFHGLAVAWAVRRAGELLERPADDLALIVAHLGSGCSVTAIEGGRSVATSMGLTPLEGLMMGTRAGSFDPGVMLHLLRGGGRERIELAELAEALDHEAGLLGVSGVSGDVRAVEAAAGDEAEPATAARARLALRMFARRAAEGIAAAAVALPRLDALVFSGGIGEHAGRLRADIVARLAVLGIEPISAAEGGTDRRLSARGATPAVLRVEAREDIVIAEAVAGLLGG
jgi:acetate kinase